MPLPISPRPTALLASDQALFRTQRVQAAIQDAQRQIATGLRIAKPSDDPALISSILMLQRRATQREGELQHIQQASGVLNTADAALGEAHDILIDAHSLASSQIGAASDEATRDAQAEVVSAQLAGMVELANQRHGGVAIFGGRGERQALDGGPFPADQGDLFIPFLGGVRYMGTRDNLAVDAGQSSLIDMNTNGVDAFGSLSARVEGGIDLNPGAADDVPIADIGNAALGPIHPGTLAVTVNGSTTQIDLSTAHSLGDTANLITDAIDSLAPGSGTLTVTPAGFQLSAATGNTITLSDIGTGDTLEQLALPASATGPGFSNGGDLHIRLTPLSKIANLGGGIDLASGLLVSQNATSKVADFSNDETIQDMQNTIDALNLGVRLEINDTGTGLRLISDVSGPRLSVGENGGTTARDLGLLSYGPSTLLSDFRESLGVETQAGEPDIAITLHDGSAFDVNLSNALTVGDVVASIQAAASAAGVGAGGFTVDYATVGTGLTFTDNTTGPGSFSIDNAGLSLAASHLGIAADGGTGVAGATLQGQDNAKVRVDSVFTHLADLRDALQNNSSSGITLAGGALESASERVVSARGVLGARAQRLEQQSQRLQDQSLAEANMLSQLQDADLTEVITRFQQLQTQLQATLQTSAQSLQLSLLDFLR